MAKKPIRKRDRKGLGLMVELSPNHRKALKRICADDRRTQTTTLEILIEEEAKKRSQWPPPSDEPGD